MIYVVGDLHGKWEYLNKLVEEKNPEMIFQCGDWGYWPNFHNKNVLFRESKSKFSNIYNNYGFNPKKCRIYFCDGNHENHWELKLKTLKNNEIKHNVFYMKRGSYLTLKDNRTVLFMGGALSVDKHLRTIGVDYFPEEVISYRDFLNLPNIEIDIVISHTAPDEFISEMNFPYEKQNDPSTKVLSEILKIYHPKLWYFGHWHTYMIGFTNGCKWHALNMAGKIGWDVKLS